MFTITDIITTVAMVMGAISLFLFGFGKLETETTVEEVNKICEIFTEDKEDIFSNDICIVGGNEIDMNEVEHIAYKGIEED